MENVDSKAINVVEFKSPINDAIQKLPVLSQIVLCTIVSKNSKLARFGSYIVTVISKDTEEEYKVYMPKYIGKHVLPARDLYTMVYKKM